MKYDATRKIVEHFGQSTQLDKLVYALLELSLSLNRYYTAPAITQELLDNMISDLADVIILCEQAKYVFTFTNIETVLQSKIMAILKYISDEKRFITKNKSANMSIS